MDGYAPQSPDLSALHHPPPALHQQQSQQQQQQPIKPTLHTRESFSLPDSARPAWAQQSPVTSQPHQYHSSYDHPSAYPHAHIKHEQSAFIPTSHSYLDSPTSSMPPAKPQEPLPVIKTKFPIARIKRIVQADEDVGKVAQATPVAVSRALEQFMIALARKSADQARARGSKKVTAADMKAAISNDEQFDFLSDIAERIPDAPSKKTKAESDSDDDAGPAKGGRKRKTAGAGGRKKKSEDTYDDD